MSFIRSEAESQPKQHSKTKKYAFLRRCVGALIVLLGVALALSYLRDDLNEILQTDLRFDISSMLLALIIQIIGFFLAVITWGQILKRFEARATFRENLRVYTYSSLGWIIPGGIWNIVARSSLYSNRQTTPEQVAVASVVERFIVGISAVLVYFAIATFQPEVLAFNRPLLGVLITILVLILIQPPIFNRIYQVIVNHSRDRLKSYTIRFNQRDLARWLVLEAWILLLGGFSLFILLTSFKAYPISILPFVIAAWAAAAIASNLFFWLPGSLILHDGVFVAILSPELGTANAIVFVILVRMWTTASLIGFALITWIILDSPIKKHLHGPRPKNSTP